MAKIKVRSINHQPVFQEASVKVGQHNQMMGCLLYMGSASSVLTLPLQADVGAWYNVDGAMMVYNGTSWELLGPTPGASPGPSYEEYPEDKIQIQVPASYWSDGQRKARVTSTVHNKPLRGETRLIAHLDELGLFPQPAVDSFWKIKGVDEALTERKFTALGISENFLKFDIKGPPAAQSVLEIMEEYVNLQAQEIMDRVTRELSDSLIYGTPITKPNYAGLFGGGI